MKTLTALLVALSGTSAFAAGTIGTFQAADIVLGQADFGSKVNPATPTDSSLFTPSAIAIDPTTGKIFIADTLNNRVLRYASAAAKTNGAAAEAVLGQPDFSSKGPATTPKELRSPFGLVCDKNGTLWVADSGNNRVLRFDAASSKATFSANADGVLGQANLSSMVAVMMPTQSSLNAPRGLAVDANGTLWVADSGKNRILRFDDAANVINGANADSVIGAPNFSIDFGGPATQYTMKLPDGLAVDAAGNLWVADYGNNRVLRFDKAAAFSNGPLASSVLGQRDYVTATLPATPTAANLSFPTSVGVDLNGALWVGDASSARALRYDLAASKAPGAAANAVLGQSLFTTNAVPMPPTATSLTSVFGLTVDAANGLWLCDTSGFRVLHYTAKAPLPPAAVKVSVSGKKLVKSTVTIRGKAASTDGISLVQYRVDNKGAFKNAIGTTNWHFSAGVKKGKHTFAIRVTTPKGGQSQITVKVTRK